MDLLRKMAGNEATTHLSKALKDYLPLTESVSMIISSQKMNETFNLATDLVMKYSPLVMKYVGVTADAARATFPYLKNIGVYYVEMIISSQKMNETFNLATDLVMKYSSLVMKYVGVTVDAARATFLYLKNIGVYCVEMIKQHPYLFGLIVLVLLVLFNCSSSSAGSCNSKKMMKAPGRNYYMPRDDFERSPRSYFQSERKRK